LVIGFDTEEIPVEEAIKLNDLSTRREALILSPLPCRKSEIQGALRFANAPYWLLACMTHLKALFVVRTLVL
jgi:hypothetical protein